jgi:hypothetical protein
MTIVCVNIIIRKSDKSNKDAKKVPSKFVQKSVGPIVTHVCAIVTVSILLHFVQYTINLNELSYQTSHYSLISDENFNGLVTAFEEWSFGSQKTFESL